MLDARRRPMGRLFVGLLSVLLVRWGAIAIPANAADGAPATTRVSDTVYSRMGRQPREWFSISSPAFTTSEAKPVAAGTKSVTLEAEARWRLTWFQIRGRLRRAAITRLYFSWTAW